MANFLANYPKLDAFRLQEEPEIPEGKAHSHRANIQIPHSPRRTQNLPSVMQQCEQFCHCAACRITQIRVRVNTTELAKLVQIIRI